MDVRVIPNLGKVTSIGATTDDDILIYDATNDGNPQYRVGSADANEGHIQAVYDAGAQTLNYLLISTDSATEGDICITPKASNNIGLGTTNPAYFVDIQGTVGMSSTLALTGTASTITLESNTQTSGNVVSIKSTPGSASTASVLCLEADGTNWGSGARVLRIVSDHDNAVPILINNGSAAVITMYRSGNIDMAGDLTLAAGGTIYTSSNGNITLLPNGSGITIVGDAGSTSHTLNTNDDCFIAGRLETDGILYADGGITLTAGNIATDTATGTKIGTATNQKIGFFNATPVVQLAKASYNNWAALGDVVNALVAIGLFDAA